jgi:thiamine pyrophosphokinase
LNKINSQQTGTSNNPDTLKFRIFLLGEEDRDIEILEVEKIDYEIINRNLNLGKSVFISSTSHQNSPIRVNMPSDSWYFYRV